MRTVYCCRRRSFTPDPLSHYSVLDDMDLNEDPSKYNDLVDSSGKVAVFAKFAERRLNILLGDHWFYIYYSKWRELVEQIQTVVIAIFEDYFHRNKWFQQSVSIGDDAVGILNLNHQLQEMIESLDSIMDSFLHMESRGQTVFINDINDVFGFGLNKGRPSEDFVQLHTLVYQINSKNEINFIRELPEDDMSPSVNHALNSSYTACLSSQIFNQSQYGTWNLMKMLPSFGRRLQLLKVRWDMDEDDLDENLSFGADVLPVLQTLRVTQLFGSSRTHAFCRVLSRSSLASSLSSIGIWGLPEEMKEQDSIALDDILAQLHDRVQIAIEKSRWKFFPKLESKGVLTIPYNYAEDLWLR
ncbi:hypothetical protein ABKN59_009697 [Abortiporus biennis]